MLNWCAAPFGTKEFELREYGVEGKHFTRDADGGPVATELGRKEIAYQYSFLVGRVPAIVDHAGDAELRRRTYLAYWQNAIGQVPGEGPVRRASSSRCRPVLEDLAADRGQDHTTSSGAAGRSADLDAVVKEWRDRRRQRGARLPRQGARRQRPLSMPAHRAGPPHRRPRSGDHRAWRSSNGDRPGPRGVGRRGDAGGPGCGGTGRCC